MSAYLARLKRIDGCENYQNTPGGEPLKPSKAPFEPFEGTPPPTLEIIDSPVRAETARPAINVLDLLAEVCREVPGLNAGQYLALLSADDVEGIRAGETGLEILRAYAPLFAQGLASGRLTVPNQFGKSQLDGTLADNRG